MRNKLALVLLIVLSACVNNTECASDESGLLQIRVGFFRSSNLSVPVDTSFTSVSAKGYPAELVGRNLNGFYLLPIPLNDKSVSYEFRQSDKSDILTVSYEIAPKYQDASCPARLFINSVEINSSLTSYTNLTSGESDILNNEKIVSIIVD